MPSFCHHPLFASSQLINPTQTASGVAPPQQPLPLTWPRVTAVLGARVVSCTVSPVTPQVSRLTVRTPAKKAHPRVRGPRETCEIAKWRNAHAHTHVRARLCGGGAGRSCVVSDTLRMISAEPHTDVPLVEVAHADVNGPPSAVVPLAFTLRHFLLLPRLAPTAGTVAHTPHRTHTHTHVRQGALVRWRGGRAWLATHFA